MISKETIDTFTKTAVNHMAESKSYWDNSSEDKKEGYRKSFKEAFKAIGVKVEGEPE